MGGVESRNYELAAALRKRGHEVTLAGFRKPPAPADGPGVRSLGELAGLYNAAGRRSTRGAIRFALTVPRIDVRGFDVVETANMPYVHIFPLALKCALAGKPLLVTWYEYWGDYWQGDVGRLKAPGYKAIEGGQGAGGHAGVLKAPVYKAIEWCTGQVGTAVTATSRLTQERLAAQRRRGGVDLVP